MTPFTDSHTDSCRCELCIVAPCQVFESFDKDGGGTISTAELGALMVALGSHPTKEELEATMQSFDDDGDGTIGFEEFLQA